MSFGAAARVCGTRPTGWRSGVISLELLVVLPALFACTLVAVQFGASLSGAVAVHEASVAGAQMASVLGRSSQAVLIAGIKNTVNESLVSAGISTDSTGPGGWCAANMQIIVQERVSDPPIYNGSAGADGPALQSVPAATSIPADCIRVTVNVRLAEVAPDLLSSFGFSVVSRFITGSTLRYFNG